MEMESTNFARYSEDWGGCHGHSGQRRRGGWAEQQRTAGEAKVGSESEEGETEHGSERDFGRASWTVREPARQVRLARPSSVARRAHPGACSLARVPPPPPPARPPPPPPSPPLLQAAQTAELLYLSSFSFSGGSAINRVLRHQNRRWHFGNIEKVGGEEGQGRRSEAPPQRPRGARGPGPGNCRASRTGSAPPPPPPTSTTDITPPPHDAIRGGGRDRCEDDRGGRRRGGGAVEGETDDD